MKPEDAVKEWLLALEAEGCRPATIIGYQSHMTPILRYLQDVQDINSMTPFHVR